MQLPSTFTKDKNTVNAIIETPHGSRNKYDYNPENDYFELGKILPSGTSFPLDFGFIPHTLGQDGDPLDILVISDFPTFPGCVLKCRLLGVIEAEQKAKHEKAIRNDRIIAVASESLCHSQLKKVSDLNDNLVDEVIHFFEYYNKMEGRKFSLLHLKEKKTALKLIKKNLKN